MQKNEELVRMLRNVADSMANQYDRVVLDQSADRIEELAGLSPCRGPEQPGDCAEVRIAVAVDHSGRAGHCSCIPGTVADQDLMQSAESEIFGPAIAQAFCMLRIPRRQIPVVTGVVEEPPCDP